MVNKRARGLVELVESSRLDPDSIRFESAARFDSVRLWNRETRDPATTGWAVYVLNKSEYNIEGKKREG